MMRGRNKLFTRKKLLGKDGLTHAPWGHVSYWCGTPGYDSPGYVCVSDEQIDNTLVHGMTTCLRCLFRMETDDSHGV